MKRLLQSIVALLVLGTGALFAQPANDNCSGAIELPLAADEGSVVLVNGDTRGGTGDANVPNVCSGTFFQDDIWYTVATGDDVPENGLVIRSYFGTESTDVLAVGMALYYGCGSEDSPITCFSSSDPDDDRLTVSAECLTPNTTYYLRVWSGVSATDNSGTLRVGAYPFTGSADNILWEETWGDSLDGWETFGTCNVADSNANATWKYLPDGLVDDGAFIFAGAAINSYTLCNGAVGVDSDFDDNNGTGEFGSGPCPAPGQYFLVSPAMDISEWNVAGASITWTQAIRQYQSTYFVSYRTHDGTVWGDWNDFQVNDEYELNSDFFTNDVVRLFMAGATDGDSLQIRFVYNANYYMWAIDDVRLVETEAHNMRSMSNFYAIAPALNLPLGQEREFYGLNDIYNAGSVAQTDVNLNLSVSDGSSEIYNDNVSYGTIGPDSLAENVNFGSAVDYSGYGEPTTFTGTYTVTSDSCTEDNDFDFTDNQNTFSFHVNSEGLFAYEDTVTGSFNVATGLYDDGAPYSWTWGIYVNTPKGSEVQVEYVNWGISNPEDIPGQSINVILFQWMDLDGNQIVQANERTILGFASVPIIGDEAPGTRWDTPLENFNVPGEPIVLSDGGEYLIMIEYNAADQTGVFLNASEAYDYSALALSSEQAGTPYYQGVLGFSSDGNVQGIDYEIKEFGDDGRTFFGNDIVPAVRLYTSPTVGTKDILDDSNVVDLYPNPANRDVTVRLDLAENYNDMQIQVLDISGRLMETRTIGSVQTQTIELNVADYASGAYILKLQTEKGFKTKRFVVQH